MNVNFSFVEILLINYSRVFLILFLHILDIKGKLLPRLIN
jgi:hypothetical protein